MPSWSFKFFADQPTVPLSSLAPESFKIIYRNKGADELRMVFAPDKPEGSALNFDLRGGIQAFTTDGNTTTRVFVGFLSKIRHRQSGSNKTVEVTWSGGWAYLSRNMYYQTWPAGHVTPSVGTYNKPYRFHYTSHVILGRCPAIFVDSGLHADNVQLTFNEQICHILQTAGLTEGLSDPLHSEYIQVSNNYVPMSERYNITGEEAMNACLSYFPDVSTWFDYGTTAFHATRSRGTPLNVQAGPAVELDVARSASAEVVGVSLRFENYYPSPSSNPKYYSSSAYGYSSDDAIRAVMSDPELSPFPDTLVETFGMLDNVAPRDISAGLAEQIYNSARGPFFDGHIVLVGETPPGLGTYRPGKSINITGGNSEWASMSAPIQTVEFDIGEGRTTISFGPHPPAGPQDLVSLALSFRNHTQVQSLSRMSTSAVSS